MNSSVIEKIKKLFALAQSDNAHERDTALAKAQRIATENQVDLALLDLSSVGVVKEEALTEEELTLGKRLEVHKKFVARIVRDACNVDILYRSTDIGFDSQKHRETGVYGRLQTLSFLGKVSDVTFAKWLYPFLLDEYVRRWNYERKAHDLPAGHRNTFFLGVFEGQNQKLAAERNSAKRDAIARHAAATPVSVAGVESAPAVSTERVTELTQKYALTVVNEQSRRRAFLKEKYPRTHTMRSSAVSIRSHDTYAAGTAHGRSIGLNRPIK